MFAFVNSVVTAALYITLSWYCHSIVKVVHSVSPTSWCHVTILFRVVHISASDTKQHNLVPAKKVASVNDDVVMRKQPQVWRMPRLIFQSCVNRGFNAHLFLTFFTLFVFRLQVDIVSPLLLNASLLLVLTTDYSDWLMQVTELTDNWQWRSLVSFDDCLIQVYRIDWLN